MQLSIFYVKRSLPNACLYNQVFEIKVGNLLPGETLTVNIGYVQELQNDTLAGDLVRFCLPMTIAPRYQAKDTPVSEQINIVYSEAAREYTLELDITCMMSGNIIDMKSTTHTITIDPDLNDSQSKTA